MTSGRAQPWHLHHPAFDSRVSTTFSALLAYDFHLIVDTNHPKGVMFMHGRYKKGAAPFLATIRGRSIIDGAVADVSADLLQHHVNKAETRLAVSLQDPGSFANGLLRPPTYGTVR